MGTAYVMRLTFLYHSPNCRGIVRHLASEIGKIGNSPGVIEIVQDTEFLPPGDTIVVRWNSKRITTGLQEVNTRAAVVQVDNKAVTRLILEDLAPRTVTRTVDLFFPCIIRPKHHFGGNNFFVCRNRAEALRAIGCTGAGWYASEIIDKTNEYRVFVLQNRVVAVTQKFAPTADEGGELLMWNFAQGGKAEHVVREEWPIKVCVAAMQGATKLGLDFVAVDLGCTAEGVYIFEGNTAPGVSKQYTVKRLAKVFDWLRNNAGTTMTFATVTARRPTWKDLIHPALLR
jgi:glutathione synthase/RimK-type ligase-like ATP-grasp enzyme